MRFLALLLIPFFLFGEEITLKFLKDKPKSLAKDWYISRFLDQKNIKPHEADAAFEMVFSKNEKITKKYLAITKNKEVLKHHKCKSLSIGAALKEDDRCLYLATSLISAFYATKEERELASNRLKKEYPALSRDILFFNKPNLKEALFELSGKEFVKFFNAIPNGYKKKELNAPFPPELLERISGAPGLHWLIKEIFKDEALSPIKESLYDLNGSKISAISSLFLISNAIKEDKLDKALNLAIGLGNHQNERIINRDNGLLWAYLLSNDERFLKMLSESEGLNIFSLYAKEKLGAKKNLPTSTSASNREKSSESDFSDPFMWVELNNKAKDANKSELAKMAAGYDNYDGEPYRAFLLKKMEGYSKYSFLMPYPNEFGKYSKERWAMLLALAKQESNFIPTVVSTSYALGMMQIMPFNVEHIQKARKLPIKYEEAFKYKTAVEYSNLLVNDLQKSFSHPLFISYGYNGGAGFTRKTLKSGLFKEGKYEPWLSMELVTLDESRDYGKKVLGNYVVYGRLLGLDVSAVELIENMKNPFASFGVMPDGRGR